MDRIYYISQGVDFQTQFNNIQLALDAGVQLIQIRYKDQTILDFQYLLDHIISLNKAYNATIIINDALTLVKNNGVAGIHLGQEDSPILEAKTLLEGTQKLIGLTCNTFEQIKVATDFNVSYVGVGPYQFTNTKSNLSPVLGIKGYESILKNMQEAHINVPLFAIGGISLNDIRPLLSLGVYGIAVSGLLTQGTNTKQVFKTIQKAITNL